MSQSTATKQKEILNTQSNTQNEENKSSYSITNKPIDGTVFRLVGTEEKGYAIAFREYLLTDFTPTEEEALSQLKLKKWEITTNLIIAIINIDKTLGNTEFKPIFDNAK